MIEAPEIGQIHRKGICIRWRSLQLPLLPNIPAAMQCTLMPIVSDRAIDDVRPLKVLCIGAGISGILAAINLPKQVQQLDLTIYDKNEELGGTWFENSYPGCACGVYGSFEETYQRLIHFQTYPPIATNSPLKPTLRGRPSTPNLPRSLSTGKLSQTSMDAGNT